MNMLNSWHFFLTYIEIMFKDNLKFKIHSYSTRNSESYRSHFCRTNFKMFSILYQGPRIWNSLPMHIKTGSSFQSFKQLMKLFLRNKQDNVTHI